VTEIGSLWSVMRSLVAAAACLAMLAGCGQVKSALGVGTKKSPDEMQVLARPPLVMPPDFNLRPPEPGAPETREEPVRDQAARILTGNAGRERNDLSRSDNLSQGEQAFLQKAGADRADPEIRQVLAEENPRYAEGDGSFIDTLMFWRDGGTEDGNAVVDAAREAERLQRAAAEGRRVDGSEVPIIERKSDSGLGEIFGTGLF